ncbi:MULTISPECIES: tyrosine-type recombinase/integrase [unclassified Sulfitobacter]|uniref:tyrosine-type recombinase/integrase n=1 Tax=unclassified Sulfitobacter TaxID=196795 RepID=UPI003746A127
MAKNKLTALQVKSAGTGKLFDGGGLTLVKTDTGGNWVYRYSHLGRRREMGLGAYPGISLAQARKERDQWAGVLASGRDPISEREAARAEEIAERDKQDPTFQEITLTVFEAKKDGLRGGGVRGRWLSPLERHVFPKLGKKRLSQIHQTDIRDTLAPIWKTKHPTAEKAIQRIGVVFKSARLMGYDCDPFTVDAARHMLGEARHKPQHIAATPWQEIPGLYQRLEGLALSRLCLRWMILTLVRSHGCRLARFDEIEGNVWTVPAERMKGNEGAVDDFRVPLCAEAMRIAEICAETSDGFLFPSERSYGGISDVAIHKTLNRLGEQGRAHGFRTSFRTWAQDTNQPWDVSETILGHVIGNKVERTYARSDLLDRRRVVMDRWAAHVTQASADVVKLRG